MTADPFAAFSGQKYLNLETYRRDGRAVRTPLWFAAGPPTEEPVLYVYSEANSGKAKRLRRSTEARIAPCDLRGRVTGNWMPVQAEIIVSAAQQEAVMRLLDRKYWPWRALLNVGWLLAGRRPRVMIALHPA